MEDRSMRSAIELTQEQVFKSGTNAYINYPLSKYFILFIFIILIMKKFSNLNIK